MKHGCSYDEENSDCSFNDQLAEAMPDMQKLVRPRDEETQKQRDTQKLMQAWKAPWISTKPTSNVPPEDELPKLPPVEQFIEPLAQFSTHNKCPKCGATAAVSQHCDGVKKWFGRGCTHPVKVKGDHIERTCTTCKFIRYEDIIRDVSEHENLKALIKGDLTKLSKLLDIEEGVVDNRVEEVFVDIAEAREISRNLVAYINMMQ